MCEPTSIALAALGVGVASAGAGIVGQNQQYGNAVDARNAADAFAKQRYLENAKETQRDVSQQIDTLRLQHEQVRMQTAAQIKAVSDDARKSIGITTSRNAERGIKGRSSIDQLAEFERDFTEFENLRLQELKDRGYQMNLETLAIRNRGQSIINSGIPQPLPNILQPTPLVPILQGATAGLGVASSLSTIANSDMIKGLNTASITDPGAASAMSPSTSAFYKAPGA
jgi:hypothetical protein